jgi:ADYC domain
MKSCTSRIVTVCTVGLITFVYACVVSEDTSTGEQAGENLNGSNVNGSNVNGSNVNGGQLLAFLAEGATNNSVALTDLRVYKGELIAERSSVTLRGVELDETELQAHVRTGGSGGSITTITYKITDVTPEVGNDPTGTGSTFLYAVKQWNGTAWVDACPLDQNNQRLAIPVAAEWDETGHRTDDSSKFTLACTAGVIAKCYRWGYRPWVTTYGDLATMHWTCTRLARADWCGDGVSHTTDGTWINVWDTLPTPGPIQTQATVPGMEFDSGWNTSGATCLSNDRWSVSGSIVESLCPAKLGTGAGRIVCNSQGSAPGGSTMFKEMDIVP